MLERDILRATLRRAAGLASSEQAAVVTATPNGWTQHTADIPAFHLIAQPEYRGTAFEVLLALLWLQLRTEKPTAVVFLPSGHRVGDEAAMTASLHDMIDWIYTDPSHVYLLGALPQPAAGEFGYIVPWNDSLHIPSSVYEFVESPDTRQAQKLINAGALLNTFIFGGTVSGMLSLFTERFGSLIQQLRLALRAYLMHPADFHRLRTVYHRLSDTDFSRELLASQPDKLKVLRMPSCGWTPLPPGVHSLSEGLRF